MLEWRSFVSRARVGILVESAHGLAACASIYGIALQYQALNPLAQKWWLGDQCAVYPLYTPKNIVVEGDPHGASSGSGRRGRLYWLQMRGCSPMRPASDKGPHSVSLW